MVMERGTADEGENSNWAQREVVSWVIFSSNMDFPEKPEVISEAVDAASKEK